MSVKQFMVQLLLVTSFVGVVLWLLSSLPIFQAHQQLSWLSLLLFFVISIVMYFTGRWGVNNDNKNTFIGLMYAYMGGKMFLSVVLIMLYYFYVEPNTKLFILPFFVVYLIFTIFESYFLMKLNDDSRN
ncbi:MAG: hypothetical protein AB8G11_12030 [Saprospiraceae bacterium]